MSLTLIFYEFTAKKCINLAKSKHKTDETVMQSLDQLVLCVHCFLAGALPLICVHMSAVGCSMHRKSSKCAKPFACDGKMQYKVKDGTGSQKSQNHKTYDTIGQEVDGKDWLMLRLPGFHTTLQFQAVFEEDVDGNKINPAWKCTSDEVDQQAEPAFAAEDYRAFVLEHVRTYRDSKTVRLEMQEDFAEIEEYRLARDEEIALSRHSATQDRANAIVEGHATALAAHRALQVQVVELQQTRQDAEQVVNLLEAAHQQVAAEELAEAREAAQNARWAENAADVVVVESLRERQEAGRSRTAARRTIKTPTWHERILAANEEVTPVKQTHKKKTNPGLDLRK